MVSASTATLLPKKSFAAPPRATSLTSLSRMIPGVVGDFVGDAVGLTIGDDVGALVVGGKVDGARVEGGLVRSTGATTGLFVGCWG